MLFCDTFSHVPGNGKVLVTNSTTLLRREKLYKSSIFRIYSVILKSLFYQPEIFQSAAIPVTENTE